MHKYWPILVACLVVFGCNSNTENLQSKKKLGVGNPPADSVNHLFAPKDSPDENAAAAEKAFDQLTSQFESDLARLREQIANAKNAEESQTIFRAHNPAPGYVDQMLRLAQTFPETPSAFQAVLAAIGQGQGQKKISAMNLLLDDFSGQIDHTEVVDSLLKEVPSPQIEGWLRKLVASAPDGKVHAETLLGFKTYFDQMPVFRSTLELNPHLAQRLPADQVAYINSDRTQEQQAEIELYLQTVIDQYADLKYGKLALGSSDTFGEVAKYELYELRNLSIGKMAPEIVGNDLDGATFKLSDYRGKVVMLDFWGHWCRPCRMMYPHERHLVNELTGLPFVLLGVNSDNNIETARRSVVDDKLPWRNFWNGPQGTEGPISKQWNISAWPTIYLIDGDGIIRYKDVHGQRLDQAINHLMAEQGFDIDVSQTKVASN